MNIAELLRSNGYKVTPQRLAVYDAIDHNMTHPNAESIYQQLQPQYPSMSLATVYKTMEIFANRRSKNFAVRRRRPPLRL